MKAEELPHDSGVYLATHAVTADTYVGSAQDIKDRISCHLSHLRKGYNGCGGLQRVSNAHGIDFDWAVLELTGEADRHSAERRWIDDLRPTLNRNRPPSKPSRPSVPGKRYPVPIDPVTRRRLKMLAASARSPVGAFVSAVYREAIDRLWADFDPERGEAAADKPGKKR